MWRLRSLLRLRFLWYFPVVFLVIDAVVGIRVVVVATMVVYPIVADALAVMFDGVTIVAIVVAPPRP